MLPPPPTQSCLLSLAPEITSPYSPPTHIPLTEESPRVPRNWGREGRTPPSGPRVTLGFSGGASMGYQAPGQLQESLAPWGLWFKGQ